MKTTTTLGKLIGKALVLSVIISVVAAIIIIGVGNAFEQGLARP